MFDMIGGVRVGLGMSMNYWGEWGLEGEIGSIPIHLRVQILINSKFKMSL